MGACDPKRRLFVPAHGEDLAEAQRKARRAWLKGFHSGNPGLPPPYQALAHAREKGIREGRNKKAAAVRKGEDGDQHLFSLTPALPDMEGGIGPLGGFYLYILQNLEYAPYSVAQHHSLVLFSLIFSHAVYQLEWGL